MTIVVDASVVLTLWLDPVGSSRLAVRLRGETMHAPNHLPVAVTNVLRRRRNAGLLTPRAAEQAFAGVLAMPVQLWPFAVVAQRAWELGPNASSYDAAYLSLAEHLDSPLLTRDARMSRAPGLRCAVEVI